MPIFPAVKKILKQQSSSKLLH